MAKDRRTKKEKIIIQLKRQLTKARQTVPASAKDKLCQEANVTSHKINLLEINKKENARISTLSHNRNLIRKDLLKVLLLSALIITIELVLYLKLGK